MRHWLVIASLIVIFSLSFFTQETIAQGKSGGTVNWVEGYISAVGVGTAKPSGNKMRDEMSAVRAATILGQRALLETIKGVKIDSKKNIGKSMLQEDAISTRIEGTIQGAEIVKQHVRWEGDTPVATVELRICLGGFGACNHEKSIISALALDQENEQPGVPSAQLGDIPVTQENIVQESRDIVYDSSRPVSGIIFNLQGISFERVILPVVITFGDNNASVTVYSVKSVEPQVIRTYGAIRYADSVDQARQNPYLGDNVIVVPVAGVTQENMITVAYHNARIIRETTSHGNDYLKKAKVVIASR